MNDERKTKKQLLAELADLRRRVEDLRASDAGHAEGLSLPQVVQQVCEAVWRMER